MIPIGSATRNGWLSLSDGLALEVRNIHNPIKARAELCELISEFSRTRFEIFRDFASLPEKYEDPIVNSFVMVEKIGAGQIYDARLSNGPIESINRNRSGARTVISMVWGFTLPRSSSPLVNARVESASTKPTFKESWERRRCIIPASYYFEWEHLINAATRKAKTGDKYMIQPEESAVTWIAGLYRIEDISGIQVPVFTILTREPSEEIRFIHDRMPVILPGESVDNWIKPDSKPDEIIKDAMTDMVF